MHDVVPSMLRKFILELVKLPSHHPDQMRHDLVSGPGVFFKKINQMILVYFAHFAFSRRTVSGKSGNIKEKIYLTFHYHLKMGRIMTFGKKSFDSLEFSQLAAALNRCKLGIIKLLENFYLFKKIETDHTNSFKLRNENLFIAAEGTHHASVNTNSC